MATYSELRAIFSEGSLRNRVEVALCVKVYEILQEQSPSEARLAWVRNILANSYNEAEAMLKYLLAANSGLSVAQLLSANDAAILSAVGAAVDKLYA